ncbi:hypothetical protein [Ferrimicrobium sp.]|uniref:hypothetical protein n=1 Tax=Ferrimicrobium sp. TaxID=2926050 RepID=UPI0026383B1C|nr:hypothetical protein [Ferrimicrobium sp.]
MDGQRQREVISALDRSLRSAIVGDIAGLRQGAATVRRLNQLPVYEELPDILERLADRLAKSDPLAANDVASQLAFVLTGGPFEPLVDELIRSLNR